MTLNFTALPLSFHSMDLFSSLSLIQKKKSFVRQRTPRSSTKAPKFEHRPFVGNTIKKLMCRFTIISGLFSSRELSGCAVVLSREKQFDKLLIISVTTDLSVSRFKTISVQLQGSAHAASVGVKWKKIPVYNNIYAGRYCRSVFEYQVKHLSIEDFFFFLHIRVAKLQKWMSYTSLIWNTYRHKKLFPWKPWQFLHNQRYVMPLTWGARTWDSGHDYITPGGGGMFLNEHQHIILYCTR